MKYVNSIEYIIFIKFKYILYKSIILIVYAIIITLVGFLDLKNKVYL